MSEVNFEALLVLYINLFPVLRKLAGDNVLSMKELFDHTS